MSEREDMGPDRSKALTLLALAAMIAVALGGVLLRVGAPVDASRMLLGVGSGIVLRTYLRSRR